MGGQGAVLAAHILSIAAFYEGMFSRSFATFGVERRGSPVTSFVMIGEKDEMTRSKIYYPNHIIVLDPHLPKYLNVVDGIKENGTLTMNTVDSQEEVFNKIKIESKKLKLGVVDATSIAQEVLGRPITNTSMLGAFIKVSEVISLDSMLNSIKSRFQGDILENNLKATKTGFEKVKIRTSL